MTQNYIHKRDDPTVLRVNFCTRAVYVVDPSKGNRATTQLLSSKNSSVPSSIVVLILSISRSEYISPNCLLIHDTYYTEIERRRTKIIAENTLCARQEPPLFFRLLRPVFLPPPSFSTAAGEKNGTPTPAPSTVACCCTFPDLIEALLHLPPHCSTGPVEQHLPPCCSTGPVEQCGGRCSNASMRSSKNLAPE